MKKKCDMNYIKERTGPKPDSKKPITPKKKTKTR
jgi:hypothetical protein